MFRRRHWKPKLIYGNSGYTTTTTTITTTTTNDDDDDRIQRRNSIGFTTSSLRRELSPTRTFIAARAQSCADHVQTHNHVRGPADEKLLKQLHHWLSGCTVTFLLSVCHRLLISTQPNRPHRERKIPGSNPACAGIFTGSSHTSDCPARRLAL